MVEVAGALLATLVLPQQAGDVDHWAECYWPWNPTWTDQKESAVLVWRSVRQTRWRNDAYRGFAPQSTGCRGQRTSGCLVRTCTGHNHRLHKCWFLSNRSVQGEFVNIHVERLLGCECLIYTNLRNALTVVNDRHLYGNFRAKRTNKSTSFQALSNQQEKNKTIYLPKDSPQLLKVLFCTPESEVVFFVVLRLLA